MDYSMELLIWNSVSVSIINVKHGLLFRQSVSELFENSVFVYAAGKNAKARANPQAILVHCFYTQADGQQKIAFLKRTQEIRHTDAVRDNRFLVVGIKKVFPGLDSVEMAYQLYRWLHGLP